MEEKIKYLLDNQGSLEEIEFEEGIKILESLVNMLNNREIGLSDLLKIYQLGVRLSEYLFKQLERAEEQIKVYKERGGQIIEEIHKAEELIEQVKGS